MTVAEAATQADDGGPRARSPRPFIGLRRRLRSAAFVPVVRVARFVFGTLSWSACQRCGRALGGWVRRLSPRDRRRALEHLAIAFPGLSEEARHELMVDCFEHLGMSLAELLHLWHRPASEASRRVEVEGFEHVEQARASGRAALVLTGHCGNWELISTANQSHGLGLVAMARELDEPGMQEISTEIRGHFGSDVIPRGSRRAASQLLRALRGGQALALLIDQDLKTRGVWVPFFDRLAHTPTAAADIARRLDAVVLPTFSERLADGSHRVTFHAPLELPEDATAATALMTQAIEMQIRRRPEQWVWFHRRWRRRPPQDSAHA